MDKERPEGWALERISRRKALKRVAAGTAVAWSAPVLTSLATPAFAQRTPDECSWVACNFEPNCGTCFGNPICRCNATTEGDTFCWNGCTPCGSTALCSSSAECSGDERCIPDNCCGVAICIGPCPQTLLGTAPEGALAGRA
jgi:hypothetical protein